MAVVTEQNTPEYEESNKLISNDVPEVFVWEQLIERTDDEEPPVIITVTDTITADVKK